MSSFELGLGSVNVLLVEDNPDDAFLLERHLRRNGVRFAITRVETAAEMSAALEGSVLPDVVLADYNLPLFSGPAALKMLRASGHDIPFIMMSGALSEETAVESMRAGAQDYVTKQNLARLVPAIERELQEAVTRRDRRAAETALKASEARFHRLVEAMPLGLLISDAEGRIVYANASVERMLAYSGLGAGADGKMGSASGSLTLHAICPALAAAAAAEGRFGKDIAVPESFEASCVTSSGQNIEVLIGVAPLNPEAPRAEQQMAAFIADVTLQKQSEEVLRRTEKLAVAGRLAASIAHEINNPLEAVTNCLFLVGQTELPEEARGYLELAQRELDRVSQITVQTLRFYRQSTRPAKTDVHELIATVLALLEQRVTRHEVEVVREFRDIPAVLMRDGEIRQVIANLVGNAVDALGERGRIVLRTACGRDWKTGSEGIRITVADNGTGMDAETKARIFEPFFSTKGITGTGLGLWVSREIAEKHRGHLRVRSRLGKGTVFSLFIPGEYCEETA
ncbi:MAG TPA: ATP-binding protein [Granulicella sp.]|jgi:signal transduction histidine kinase|nr:ATP-binding protein [Granulicella sp.]